MPKRSKIKPTEINFNTPHIKPSQIDETKKVSFNFRRLQNITNKFEYHNKNTNYFNCLITRLCEVSKMSRKEMTIVNQGKHCGLRCHQIDFKDNTVTENGFGIPGNDELDEDAWQFSLNSNEHGRIHGYFVGSIFFIVWLDPEHNLYKNKK
ncbi:MAG: hypothetical protein V1770_03125 [bacterium]